MSKSKIEWCDYTWNPITGCKNNCTYCYASKQSKRFSGDVRLNMQDKRVRKNGEFFVIDEPFYNANGTQLITPFGFKPTIHNYRFNWLKTLKSGMNVFVGSMTDLFGDWVPDEVLERVFNECLKYPRHNYMFLTKNPNRYMELACSGILPHMKNFWYGSSILTSKSEIFCNEQVNTFVCIEPILEPFTQHIDNLQYIDWIILGAETGNKKGKIIPNKEWISSIAEYANDNKIPVFMKDSLKQIMTVDFINEMPKQLMTRELSEKQKRLYFSRCGICGREFCKKDMMTLLYKRDRRESAKTLGHVCDKCFEDFKKFIGGENYEN